MYATIHLWGVPEDVLDENLEAILEDLDAIRITEGPDHIDPQGDPGDDHVAYIHDPEVTAADADNTDYVQGLTELGWNTTTVAAWNAGDL